MYVGLGIIWYTYKEYEIFYGSWKMYILYTAKYLYLQLFVKKTISTTERYDRNVYIYTMFLICM